MTVRCSCGATFAVLTPAADPGDFAAWLRCLWAGRLYGADHAGHGEMRCD